MEHYELPLVIFTVLSQMSVGMAVFLTWRLWRGTVKSNRLHWLVIGLVLAVASVAAILHLAHPDRAYDALRNLKHAWLSREILGATLYGAAVGLTFLTGGNKIAAAIASLSGLVLVAVQGMTYAAPAMVAIANGLTMLLFFMTTWLMGCAGLPLLGLTPSLPSLRQATLCSLVVLLAAPMIWLSGGTVMTLTARAWLSSPLYLGGLVCLLTALLVSKSGEHRKFILFTLLFVGMLLSRMTFFGDTVSSVVNIGHLY